MPTPSESPNQARSATASVSSTAGAGAQVAGAQVAGAQVAGVFALELSPGAALGREALSQRQAGELAGLLGRDLVALVEQARELDLVFAGAHFDPAEALRPGWPLHRRLAELHQRAPRAGGGARIIAFGAAADGEVPAPLQDEPALRGGQLRVLPFLLVGAAAPAVAARMEQVLLDRGMARADTALCAQDGFAGRIEHARYLTLHDLAAMTALQYRHQGLDGLWQVVEAALLRPGETVLVDAPPEPLLRYADGEARIAMLSPDGWRRRYAAVLGLDPEADPARAAHLFELFEVRQRQYAAALRAHGVDVVFGYCEDASDL